MRKVGEEGKGSGSGLSPSLPSWQRESQANTFDWYCSEGLPLPPLPNVLLESTGLVFCCVLPNRGTEKNNAPPRPSRPESGRMWCVGAGRLPHPQSTHKHPSTSTMVQPGPLGCCQSGAWRHIFYQARLRMSGRWLGAGRRKRDTLLWRGQQTAPVFCLGRTPRAVTRCVCRLSLPPAEGVMMVDIKTKRSSRRTRRHFS